MPATRQAANRQPSNRDPLNRQPGDSAPPLLAASIPNQSAAADSGTRTFDLSVYFNGATSYSISPALEAGWSFNTTTGVLTIDTDATATFGPYTVTGTNADGSVDSNAFTVRVVLSVGAQFFTSYAPVFFYGR